MIGDGDRLIEATEDLHLLIVVISSRIASSTLFSRVRDSSENFDLRILPYSGCLQPGVSYSAV